MKKLSIIIIILILAMETLSFAGNENSKQADNEPLYLAGRCLAPLKPLKPMKPIWCQGQWVQVLKCDQMCNCYWDTVCYE